MSLSIIGNRIKNTGLLFCLSLCTVAARAQDNFIIGAVKDEKNCPVRGARLILLIYPDIKQVSVVQADSAGFYRFKNLPEGKYIVLAMASGMKINQSAPFILHEEEKEFTVPDIIMDKPAKKRKRKDIPREKIIADTQRKDSR